MWTIKKFTKKRSSSSAGNDQQTLAADLYARDPNYALRIALGEENAPVGILAAAIYAKVCIEAEKAQDMDTCGRLANSLYNSKISAEAQKLKLRDADAPIEIMKDVVNARLESFSKTLPRGKSIEQAINEEAERIRSKVENLEPSIVANIASSVVERVLAAGENDFESTIKIAEAEKITASYGDFLEWAFPRLYPVFFSNIPKSLLPYRSITSCWR